MKRIFRLTIYCRNEFKNTPLALECKEAIMREMPYLTAVNVKEEGKKLHHKIRRRSEENPS